MAHSGAGDRRTKRRAPRARPSPATHDRAIPRLFKPEARRAGTLRLRPFDLEPSTRRLSENGDAERRSRRPPRRLRPPRVFCNLSSRLRWKTVPARKRNGVVGFRADVPKIILSVNSAKGETPRRGETARRPRTVRGNETNEKIGTTAMNETSMLQDDEFVEDDHKAAHNVPGERSCLSCGEKFMSEGWHNRLCLRCRKRSAPDYF